MLRPDDGMCSPYADVEKVIATIEATLASLEYGNTLNFARLQTLYAPNRSLQEISIAQGWSDAFLQLADRFDQAVYQVRAMRAITPID